MLTSVIMVVEQHERLNVISKLRQAYDVIEGLVADSPNVFTLRSLVKE